MATKKPIDPVKMNIHLMDTILKYLNFTVSERKQVIDLLYRIIKKKDQDFYSPSYKKKKDPNRTYIRVRRFGEYNNYWFEIYIDDKPFEYKGKDQYDSAIEARRAVEKIFKAKIYDLIKEGRGYSISSHVFKTSQFKNSN